jgi:acetyl-CoA carboxylase biotin carboxyl carrier protein
MPDHDKSDGESFDLDRIKQLIRLMEKHDLTEVKLEGGEQKWVLRRGSPAPAVMAPPGYALPAAPPPLPPPQPAASPPEGSPSSSSPAESGLLEVVSPTVGTFYQSPQPGDPPFVKVGDTVNPDSIVCIVEAMKVFNQIPAEVSGTISKILVSDGEAVEFGQALFAVTPG